MHYSLTKFSKNTKTGPITLITAGRETCWDDCPFLHICYGENFHCRLHWDRVSDGRRGGTLQDVCREIKCLASGSIVRWGDMGDLPGDNDFICSHSLEQIVRACRGRIAFAYTHKPVLQHHGSMRTRLNREKISETNQNGFTVNLSGEGANRADELADLRIAPVVTVVPSDQAPADWRTATTPAGRKVVRCPAEWGRVQCWSCGGPKGPLCARVDRDYIIGLTAHGVHEQKVNAVVHQIEASYP